MANTEKMTIHKALAELKTLDDRIISAMREQAFCVAVKHSAEKINGKAIPQVKEDIKACYQKTQDLIARRNAMKRAVVLSNARTMVNIAGKEYTVAEAIDMKNNGIANLKSLYFYLTEANTKASAVLTQNSQEEIEKRADQYVLSVIQAQPKDSKMAVDSDAMKEIRKAYVANNTYDLIDPINCVETAKKILEDINAFQTEVDAALSVSNALTTIEFSY